MSKPNSYTLSRNFFNFTFDNPEKVTPNHVALYFYIIEHCNRLGWKEKFGLPTAMAKEAIGIKSYNTYIKTLNDLIDWGFIILIQKSQNQHSSNIVALSNFDKPLDKSLDKAMINHLTNQSEITHQTKCSINKQQTNKPQTTNIAPFDFSKKLIDLGADKQLVSDWLKVRKTKKATNTLTAFNKFKVELDKSKLPINEVLEICISKDWKGFNAEWVKNIQPSQPKRMLL